MEIRQLHRDFMADISGLDLSTPIDEATATKVREAIAVHAAGVVHGPTLTDEAQIAFAENFGPIEGRNGILDDSQKRRISARLADVSNIDEKDAVFGENDRRRMFSLGNQLWHTDSSFKAIPAAFSLLHAHSVTPEGGETQLVDTRAAWDALPQKMKDRIEGMVAEHSIFCSRAKLGFTEFSEEERRRLPPVHRPLVRIHPPTGRKAIYIASHASHIVGMNVPDGKMLIRELLEHCTQPEFVHTHRWEVGDVLIWDNRCTMHRGRPYDDKLHRRDMRRATVEDTDPAMRWPLAA